MLKERLEKIRKELKYNFSSSVYNSKDISVSNNKTLVKKLEENRNIIANSFHNDTSRYK